MRPNEKLRDAVGRLPIVVRILLVVWLGLGGLCVTFDDLNKNLPPWSIIFLAVPWISLSVYLALSMDWMGIRSIAGTSQTPECSNEIEPADLYRAGEISHPEMMRRYEEREWRGLEDMQGCRLILSAVGMAGLGFIGLFPRNPDHSMKAEVLILFLTLIGLASAYLLRRGTTRRSIKWACYTLLAIAAVGIPVGLVSIVGR
jgi:hypothetical protein